VTGRRGGSVATLVAAMLVALGSPVGVAAVEPIAAHGQEGALLAYADPVRLSPDLVEQALPPPPQIVKRETGYYGTVSIDHRAHLARRAGCKTCHGPGPVTKIEFTPRLAHDRCVGCHQTAQRGPTDCTGCHVKREAETQLASATAGPKGAGAPGSPAPAPVAEPSAAEGSISAPAPAVQEVLASAQMVRRLDVGLAAGSAIGASLGFSFASESFLLEQGIDRLSGADDVRTFVTFGAGIARSLRRDLQLVALGLGGLDAVAKPASGLMPALGGRVAVEWTPPRSWVVQTLRFSLSGVVDVANRQALGRDLGGTHVYATLSTGFQLGPR
jgi:hypothetical protein